MLRRPTDILRLMALCGAHFAGASWDAWRVVLRALFGLPLDAEALATYRALTGRTEAPTEPARELWCVCGRRAGKSIIAALVVVYLATCRTYRLAPGERGVCMVIAADRRQARVVRRYVGGLLRSSPVLSPLIARETREAVELTTGVTIEIHTASYRTIRGYTVVGAVLDELAFWPTDETAAEPDREIVAALRPAMATVPDALLLCLSSPYARRGELHRAHAEHYGHDGDPVLVVQAPTRALNPTVPQAVIDGAYAEDAARASAEYGAEFRRDVETYVSSEAIAAAVAGGRRELAPRPGVTYTAFTDPAGGSGADSFTLAVAHSETREGRSVAVLDCVREAKPPFSPEQVVREFAETLRAHHVDCVTGDRYAGEWPREQFRKHGVEYQPSARTRNEIYGALLPAVNSQAVELLDEPRLLAQLGRLERRTGLGGRDTIDHGPHGHDDAINAAAGALVLTARESSRVPLELLDFGRSDDPEVRRLVDELVDAEMTAEYGPGWKD